MKTRLLFLYLSVMILIFYGCNTPTGSGIINSCDDIGEEYGAFQVLDISLKAYINNGEQIQEISPGSSVSIDNVKFIANSGVKWLHSNINVLDYFMPVAYACSVVAPYSTANINDFKMVLVDSMQSEEDFTDSVIVLNETENNSTLNFPLALTEYVSYQPLASREYTLGINSDLSVNGEYSVKVVISLSDGSTYENTIGPFQFN